MNDYHKARNNIDVSVGDSVRIIRELQGFSRIQLAALTEIPQSIISAIENDRISLSLERAKIFSRALRCHPAVLNRRARSRNRTVFIEPWQSIETHYSQESVLAIELEAVREIAPDHSLFGKILTAIARRIDCDDVLFKIDSGPEYACVHLTWSRKQEPTGWPSFKVYSSLEEFVSIRMNEDAEFYE